MHNLYGQQGAADRGALIFEMGQTGRTAVDLPEPRRSRIASMACAAPARSLRASRAAGCQHYTRLSQKNYAIDMGVYPWARAP